MTSHGPSEASNSYIGDTGASGAEIGAQVEAYKASITALKEKVLPMGGFWMQLIDGFGVRLGPNGKCLPKCNVPLPADQCTAILRELCVGANSSTTPSSWNRFQLYNIPNGGRHVSPENFTDYTAEFLLTRGPYAVIGYSWYGCTVGDNAPNRAVEWDQDFGLPEANGLACAETSAGTGVFTREYTKATVTWDCAVGHGNIKMK